MPIFLPSARLSRAPEFGIASPIENHIFKSGYQGTSAAMRKPLTGCAQYFNRRPGCCGLLFEKSYKSILCGDSASQLEQIEKGQPAVEGGPVQAGIAKRGLRVIELAKTFRTQRPHNFPSGYGDVRDFLVFSEEAFACNCQEL